MRSRETHGECRWAVLLAIGVALVTTSAGAGSLTGPIGNDNAQAILEDFVELPTTSGSRPLARVNMLREAPDGSGRLFVNDLRGPLYVIDGPSVLTYMDFAFLFPNLKTAPGLASGFVSFALHPDFASNGLFYTVHSEFVGSTPPNMLPVLPATVSQHSILTEWTATTPSANLFAGSSRELIRIGAFHHVHNMGEIAFNPNAVPFDPDYGLLYITAGDHGAVLTGDPDQIQRIDAPYGTVMRIDPLGGPFMRGGTTFDYGIPPGNPFVTNPDPTVLDEIYAYGFRNPHRLSWEAGLPGEAPFVSDIGEGNVEEVNRLVPGEKYGWPDREGTFALDVDVDAQAVFALPGNDADFGFTYPVAQYDHDEGDAIAGGFTYTGDAGSVLAGQFIFGDITVGRVFYADSDEMRAADDGDPVTVAAVRELNVVYGNELTTLSDVVADALGLGTINRVDLRFGEDSTGQLYVTTKQDGWIRKLTPVPEPSFSSLALAGIGGVLLLAALRRRGGSECERARVELRR